MNHLNPHASNVVKASRNIIAVFFAFLFFLGCSSFSTEDKAALANLKNRFGSNYEFDLEGEFYLNVVVKKGFQYSEKDIENIYKSFFFKEADKFERRDTSYVYLNLFDSNGTFLYQFFFDFNDNNFVKNHSPHY